jgi:catechol 2,3-dioxygenase
MVPNGSLPPETHIGSISLAVAHLETSLAFYQSLLGLQLHQREGQTAQLGPSGPGGISLVELVELPNASQPARATGLFHLAIRVPSALELARALRRLINGSWPLQGFADHGVSQAIYLADPDGNGIEIYRDYPRPEWPYQNGQLIMSTDPLDVDGLLAELRKEPGEASLLPPQTDLGHVHLKVADIPSSEIFYCKVLGFDLVQRYGHAASFVSAGGYHHHIGMNTWGSLRAAPPPPGSLGLRHFTIHLPDLAGLEATLVRLGKAGTAVLEAGTAFEVQDPSGNIVRLEPNARR